MCGGSWDNVRDGACWDQSRVLDDNNLNEEINCGDDHTSTESDNVQKELPGPRLLSSERPACKAGP